jgi:hypothetical protein
MNEPFADLRSAADHLCPVRDAGQHHGFQHPDPCRPTGALP